MKKKLLLFAVLGLFAARVMQIHADSRSVPTGPQNALASADYGGVDVATSAFTTNMSTGCSSCSGVFYSVGFTTGSNANVDYVDVFDVDFASNAVINSSGTRIARLYNIATSSHQLTSAGYVSPPKPIRFKKGLQFQQGGTGLYNLISILYTKLNPF